MSDDKVVVCIDRSSSTCLACGDGCDFTEKMHKTILGYTPRRGEPGCGATFTHVTTMYVGQQEMVMELRPDLEWMPTEEAVRYRNAKSQERNNT